MPEVNAGPGTGVEEGGEERGHPPVLLNQDRRATGEEGKGELCQKSYAPLSA